METKYLHNADRQDDAIIYVSGKQAEEVGFEKFARRQAQLRGIHVLVLDRMRIRHLLGEDDLTKISSVCSHITDLDLSCNLFETFGEIATLCRCLPKLRSLTLDGNRFSIGGDAAVLSSVQSLSLSDTLLTWPEMTDLMRQHFAALHTVVATKNALSDVRSESLPGHVHTLDLSGNDFVYLDQIWPRHGTGSLRTVLLKQNRIGKVFSQFPTGQSTLVEDLDLSRNTIDDWQFFNSLVVWAPHLKHLRVTGNHLYANLQSAESKSLTTEDGYMLTIARLPTLETLNYSKITEKERLNAETYYLNQIAAEVSRRPSEEESGLLSKHPRYQALCEEYGEPSISRKHDGTNTLDPNTLAYRLTTVHFILQAENRSWTEEIPRSFSIYAVLGLVAARLHVRPLKLRLVWQTGERDPGRRELDEEGPQEWDSDAEEEPHAERGESWTERELELVAGTRLLGTYVEGREATVRIEMVG